MNIHEERVKKLKDKMGSSLSNTTYTDTNTEDCTRIVKGMNNLVGSHIIDLYMPTIIQDLKTVLVKPVLSGHFKIGFPPIMA